ncbi:hypothetical protein EDC48_11785 [Gibbsiella quercinecans]|nr:hypothetical protein EDC48_11785 [Gibbsiella quercinecans]
MFYCDGHGSRCAVPVIVAVAAYLRRSSIPTG